MCAINHLLFICAQCRRNHVQKCKDEKREIIIMQSEAVVHLKLNYNNFKRAWVHNAQNHVSQIFWSRLAFLAASK